jgi:hypothetical protein
MSFVVLFGGVQDETGLKGAIEVGFLQMKRDLFYLLILLDGIFELVIFFVGEEVVDSDFFGLFDFTELRF